MEELQRAIGARNQRREESRGKRERAVTSRPTAAIAATVAAAAATSEEAAASPGEAASSDTTVGTLESGGGSTEGGLRFADEMQSAFRELAVGTLGSVRGRPPSKEAGEGCERLVRYAPVRAGYLPVIKAARVGVQNGLT